MRTWNHFPFADIPWDILLPWGGRPLQIKFHALNNCPNSSSVTELFWARCSAKVDLLIFKRHLPQLPRTGILYHISQKMTSKEIWTFSNTKVYKMALTLCNLTGSQTIHHRSTGSQIRPRFSQLPRMQEQPFWLRDRAEEIFFWTGAGRGRE